MTRRGSQNFGSLNQIDIYPVEIQTLQCARDHFPRIAVLAKSRQSDCLSPKNTLYHSIKGWVRTSLEPYGPFSDDRDGHCRFYHTWELAILRQACARYDAFSEAPSGMTGQAKVRCVSSGVNAASCRDGSAMNSPYDASRGQKLDGIFALLECQDWLLLVLPLLLMLMQKKRPPGNELFANF